MQRAAPKSSTRRAGERGWNSYNNNLHLGLSAGVGGKVKVPSPNFAQISPTDGDVRQQIVGHLEKNYVFEFKQQPTDPGFTDRSGALQAGSRIGLCTSFVYHCLLKILSLDAHL